MKFNVKKRYGERVKLQRERERNCQASVMRVTANKREEVTRKKETAKTTGKRQRGKERRRHGWNTMEMK